MEAQESISKIEMARGWSTTTVLAVLDINRHGMSHKNRFLGEMPSDSGLGVWLNMLLPCLLQS